MQENEIKDIITSRKDNGIEFSDGYRGIWYYNQPSNDEYRFKYSGGLGTYSAKHIPIAYYSKECDKTFFCYGGRYKEKNQLLHMVSYYDHKKGIVPKPTILLDKQTDDAHDNPTIMLDAQGYIWIFSSSHGTSRPSYISKSLEPYSIDAFETILETNFSYPQCWFVERHGFLFLHTKYNKGRRVLSWSTSKNGIDWSETKILSSIKRGHYQISWKHKNKVGTAFNYHPRRSGLNSRTNLYYIETKDFGTSWQNIQGKTLNTPLKSVKNEALVQNFRKKRMLVYLKDLNYDLNGNPIILYLISSGFASGLNKSPRIWMTSYWNGSDWETRQAFESDSNYDTGCLHINHLSDNEWRIIAPSEKGPQPFNPGGEIAIWTTKNYGKSWEKAMKITENSEFNHTYVRKPVNAHDGFYAFWADGNPRKVSESRLYFCDKNGKVNILPDYMDKEEYEF